MRLSTYTWHILCTEPALTTLHNAAMDDNPDDDHPPEWTSQTEYIQVLRSSTDPLLQLLANIEHLDGTLRGLGQCLEDARTYSLEMIEALDDTTDSLAVAIVRLLDQTAHTRLPTLIGHAQTARHVLAYARLQVTAFPDLVDRRSVPRNMNAESPVFDPPATVSTHPSRHPGAESCASASTANEVALTSTAAEYFQALRSSIHPLPQLLATIEDSDVVCCALGQLLEDELTDFLEWITILADADQPLAGTLSYLLEQAASRFSTLIITMHTARYVLAHARMQVHAYPALVDRQEVLRTAVEGFQVLEPPVEVSSHTLRNAGAVFRTHGNQCGHH